MAFVGCVLILEVPDGVERRRESFSKIGIRAVFTKILDDVGDRFLCNSDDLGDSFLRIDSVQVKLDHAAIPFLLHRLARVATGTHGLARGANGHRFFGDGNESLTASETVEQWDRHILDGYFFIGLEHTMGRKAPTRRIQELQVRLLALADAAFAPQRYWSPLTASTAYSEARVDFRKHGILWKVAGDGQRARREDAHRLAESGLAVVEGGERLLWAKLTDGGDVESRRLCGLPGLDSAWYAMREIRKSGVTTVHETYLGRVAADDPGFAADLLVTETMLLPGLIRGWVVSDTTTKGSAVYGLTPLGLEVLKNAKPPDVDDASHDHDLRQAYFSMFEVERQRIRIADPHDPKDIGNIAWSQGLLIKLPPFNGVRRKRV